MDIRCVLIFVSTVVYAKVNFSDATICKPNSIFKMDCNTCQCSTNGKEYSCTTLNCPPNTYKTKFDLIETKNGYKVWVPKSTDEFNFDDDNFTLKRSRKSRTPQGYPYIHDEMFKPEINKDIAELKENKPEEEDKFLDVDEDLDAVENVDEENNGNTIDDEDLDESNEVNHERWERFLPRKIPVYPE